MKEMDGRTLGIVGYGSIGKKVAKIAQAFDMPKVMKAAEAGDISGDYGYVYPPGIPFVCPGEEISGETCAYIKALRDAGEKVIGVNDKGQVLVGRE